MFVRDLHQGQKFRIINSSKYDSSNQYIYLGICTPIYKVSLVLTNLYGQPDRFYLFDHDMSVLDEQCELITNTIFGQGKKVYSKLQSQWLSEYKVKPGDTVKIVGNAPPYPNIEGGNFSCDKLAELAGNLYTIRRVDEIRVVVDMGYGVCRYLPYWSLEVQDEVWTPMSYADRADLLGARIESNREQLSYQISSVHRNGIRSGYMFIHYGRLSECYHWMDGPNAGKPVGKIGYLPRKV